MAARNTEAPSHSRGLRIVLDENFWSTSEGISLLTRIAELSAQVNDDPAALALRASNLTLNPRPELVRRAIEIVVTRQRGEHLGSWASQALLTRDLLEQATRPEIAGRHAARFVGCRQVIEIGTGAGSDTAALAKVVERVVSLEQNPETAVMARHNLACQRVLNAEVLVVNATEYLAPSFPAGIDGLWADPARRDRSGNREFDPERWSPPLSFVVNLSVPGPVGIKISPGFNLHPLPEGVSREWIGWRDECLEQVLWKNAGVIDGTVYLADKEIEWLPPKEEATPDVRPVESFHNGWLIEPHAALIRSGHLEQFFATENICGLDPKIAYGASMSEPVPSPFYTAFRIIDIFPYSVSRLNKEVAALGWTSETEVKKRGLSETADELRRKISFAKKREGVAAHGVVFFTRLGSEHYCILAHRRPRA